VWDGGRGEGRAFLGQVCWASLPDEDESMGWQQE